MKDEVITTQPSSTPTSSLLVVDDNSMNRIMLSRYIAKLGYGSSVAENGRQMQQLRIEIDQERRAREVADITENDFFQQLPGKADELRNRARADGSGGIPGRAAKGLDNEA